MASLPREAASRSSLLMLHNGEKYKTRSNKVLLIYYAFDERRFATWRIPTGGVYRDLFFLMPCQAELLKQMTCDKIQGYRYFKKSACLTCSKGTDPKG
jgi:hypothetical protein